MPVRERALARIVQYRVNDWKTRDCMSAKAYLITFFSHMKGKNRMIPIIVMLYEIAIIHKWLLYF